VVIDFGDLPVNLRQEILNLLRNRNIVSPTLTITGLQFVSSSDRPHRTHQDLGSSLERSHPAEDHACGMPRPSFDMGGMTDPTSD
jgi:hypothetical protein